MKNVCAKVRMQSTHHPSAVPHLRKGVCRCGACRFPGPHKPKMPAVHPELHGRWKGGVSCQRPRAMRGGAGVQALLACVDEMGPGSGSARMRGAEGERPSMGVKAQALPVCGQGGRGEWPS